MKSGNHQNRLLASSFNTKTFQAVSNTVFWAAMGIVGISSVYHIILYLSFDYPVNFYEPEVISDVIRLLNGQTMYSDTNSGIFGGLYAPLYHVVCAGFFRIFPDTITTGRLLSVLSLLMVSWLIWASLPKRQPVYALLAFVFVFMWHYRLAEFDLHAKPDSFSSMLVIASMFFLIGTLRKPTNLYIAAALSALAIAAKQSMFFLPVGVVIWLLIQKDLKSLLRYALTLILTSIIIWGIFHFWMGEHIWFYTWKLPGLYRMRWGALAANIWAILATPAVFTVLLLMAWRWKSEALNTMDLLFLIIGALAFGSGVLSASKGGGLANSFQPIFLLSSWYLLIILAEWQQNATVTSTKSWILLSLGLLVLVTARLNPPSMITRFLEIRSDARTYATVAEELKEYDGSFYIPADNYLSHKSGKFQYGSSKWDFEISHGLNLPGIYSQNYAYIQRALRADLVVTHEWSGWMKNQELRNALIQAGFVQKNQRSFSQGLTLRIFEKHTEESSFR